MTELSSSATLKCTEATLLKVLAACGSQGIWGECGLKHNWSDLSSSYFAVRHGLMGTECKCRVKRGATVIEGSMLVSNNYKDWQTVVAALVVPSLANLIITQCVTPNFRKRVRRLMLDNVMSCSRV